MLPLDDLQELRAWATGVGAGVHLDGARIWNAHVATGVPLAEYGAIADVLVGLPVQGARRAGRLADGRARADAIDEARVRRKRMGGGMRQVGILAAAGLHALDHHVERLAEDHAHARLLAEACGVDPATVDTNIVVVERSDAAAFVAAAGEAGRPGRRGRPDRRPAGHPPRRLAGRRRGAPPRCWQLASQGAAQVRVAHQRDLADRGEVARGGAVARAARPRPA